MLRLGLSIPCLLFATLSVGVGCGGRVGSVPSQDAGGGPSPAGGVSSVQPRAPHDSGLAPPDAASRASCASDADCADGTVCAFAIAEACGATGACVEPPTPSPCGAVVQLEGCGCNGASVEWTGGCSPSLPSGYAPAPIAHTGACAAPPPACATSADCTSPEVCSFPINGGCAAMGQCLPPMPCTTLPDTLFGCACDGTSIALNCNGYAQGFVAKPLASHTACAPDGG